VSELIGEELVIAEGAARSDVGRKRSGNEDSFLFEPPLFVVADGMGGAQAGEVASRRLIQAFAPNAGEIVQGHATMREAIMRANEAIYAAARTNADLHGMGTTATCALFKRGRLMLAHVGDSRAYRLRGGVLTRLTPDHSLVDELVRRGAITEADAEHHPQRSVITRAVGIKPTVEVDEFVHPCAPGDVYLLCSDGLTKMVDEQDILTLLRSPAATDEAAQALIAAANDHGGEDNITVVVFRVAGR
jgi:serine/threonine protein phosphatase PrpC